MAVAAAGSSSREGVAVVAAVVVVVVAQVSTISTLGYRDFKLGLGFEGLEVSTARAPNLRELPRRTAPRTSRKGSTFHDVELHP